VKVLILATSTCAQQFERDGGREPNHPILPIALSYKRQQLYNTIVRL
jgi:hypothetical protein